MNITQELQPQDSVQEEEVYELVGADGFPPLQGTHMQGNLKYAVEVV